MNLFTTWLISILLYIIVVLIHESNKGVDLLWAAWLSAYIPLGVKIIIDRQKK